MVTTIVASINMRQMVLLVAVISSIKNKAERKILSGVAICIKGGVVAWQGEQKGRDSSTNHTYFVRCGILNPFQSS